jgi:hypothetical protein
MFFVFSLSPFDVSFRRSLFVYSSLLFFDPNPSFLGVTFDRTLSFRHHLLRLRSSAYPCLATLRQVSSLK